jgi:hypothetical protein
MKLKYFPLHLLILIFLFDKIFLIPQIRTLVVQNHVNSYEVLDTLQDKLYKEHIEKYKKELGWTSEKIEKETVMFMGTSRSVEYGNLTKSVFEKNPYIKNQAALEQIPVTSWTVRAAPFIHIYQIYSHFLKTHPRPRMLVLEINYISFNKNNVFREKKDIYDFTWEEFLEIQSELSNKDKIEYIASMFFVLNRSNISWKSLIRSGGNAKQDVNATLDFVINAKKLMEMKENKNAGWMQGFKQSEESKEQIAINSKYNEWVIQSFFQNFQLDLTSTNLFKKVLREAKEKNINLVLYRPRTHELLKSETTRFTKGEAKWLEDVKSLAKEYSIPFYDFEEPGSLACDYFADTSHLSKSCFPEVVEKILLEGTNKNRTDLR